MTFKPVSFVDKARVFGIRKAEFLEEFKFILPEWEDLYNKASVLDTEVSDYLADLRRTYCKVDPKDILALPDTEVLNRLQERARMATLLDVLCDSYASLLKGSGHEHDHSSTQSSCC